VVPPEVTYATVHQEREDNWVVGVSTRVVFGTLAAVALALVASAVSSAVNTCFVERHNGTDRNRCSRKVRKSYAFSKEWEVHRAATAFSDFSYNFCWPVETENPGDGGRLDRSRVVAGRVVGIPGCATRVGHHRRSGRWR